MKGLRGRAILMQIGVIFVLFFQRKLGHFAFEFQLSGYVLFRHMWVSWYWYWPSGPW